MEHNGYTFAGDDKVFAMHVDNVKPAVPTRNNIVVSSLTRIFRIPGVSKVLAQEQHE